MDTQEAKHSGYLGRKTGNWTDGGCLILLGFSREADPRRCVCVCVLYTYILILYILHINIYIYKEIYYRELIIGNWLI